LLQRWKAEEAMSGLEGQAGLVGAVGLLRAIPSLRRLSDHDLGRVAALLAERSVAAGEIVVEEGTTGHQSFLIVDGEAGVLTGGVLIARVGPGEFIGELALLTDEPRCATVRAETPMRLLVLDKTALASLIDPITEALLGTMARRLRREADGTSTASGGTVGRPTIGATVAVRSRFDGTWVEGFEIADVDLADASPRIQVRRHSDGAVLPVFFDIGDIRLP
jgi:CRP-like cAMP-binding protein